ncbi:hypothetical protein JXJ21_03750 [candidate division KSB1 bacterium]|nr:hypothetical protein [candidate division KSB1 bacterium]
MITLVFTRCFDFVKHEDDGFHSGITEQILFTHLARFIMGFRKWDGQLSHGAGYMSQRIPYVSAALVVHGQGQDRPGDTRMPYSF